MARTLRASSLIAALCATLFLAGGCTRYTAEGEGGSESNAVPLDLEITPAAADMILQLAQETGCKQWWLRYEMVPGGCQGFMNKLDLDPNAPGPGEFEHRVGEIRCVLLENQRHLVQGVQIDWGTKDGRNGFLVTAPRATEETKTAVQKWIMEEFQKRNPDLKPSDQAEADSGSNRDEPGAAGFRD
jgi:Fe-S cluster assembly iron-binding protein IscA